MTGTHLSHDRDPLITWTLSCTDGNRWIYVNKSTVYTTVFIKVKKLQELEKEMPTYGYTNSKYVYIYIHSILQMTRYY
jgi:hypothetical protein